MSSTDTPAAPVTPAAGGCRNSRFQDRCAGFAWRPSRFVTPLPASRRRSQFSTALFATPSDGRLWYVAPLVLLFPLILACSGEETTQTAGGCPDLAQPRCDGAVRLACHQASGEVIQTDCAAMNLTCVDGTCVPDDRPQDVGFDADTSRDEGVDTDPLSDASPDVEADVVEPDASEDGSVADTTADGSDGPCPDDMVHVAGPPTFCMDPYEAPNVAGEPPLVMMSLNDGEAWCSARGKRVCFDDEWRYACAGPDGLAYPYGPSHDPGVCNDDNLWRVYNQPLLSGWPSAASGPEVTSFDHQLQTATDLGAAASANHVDSLYQGAGGGEHPGCVSPVGGIYDLTGNVEEWTRRRDGGDGPQFNGNLKGRYWAETRTCQSRITTHGDAFRFYETGFRCCRDPTP